MIDQIGFSSETAWLNEVRTTVPHPSPGNSSEESSVSLDEDCPKNFWRSRRFSGLPARSTALTTTASTFPFPSSTCAVSRALETECSSAEMVKAGPLKSQSDAILEAMMLPMKLVNWLTGTDSWRLSRINLESSSFLESSREIPCLSRLFSICCSRLILPRKRCSSSSVSMATKTATFPPS